MINLYKIKWTQKDSGGGVFDRAAFVLADNVAQVAQAYPSITSLEWTGAIAKDLRELSKDETRCS